MILNITVENFRSYREPQTLSLLAADDSQTHANQIGEYLIRKSVVIYGANASGKSNLIEAFQTINTMINKGIPQNPPHDFVPSFFNNSDPTSISLDISVNNEIYTYSVSYDREKIHKEELFDLNDKLIFSRVFNQEKGNYSYDISQPELILDQEQLKVKDSLLQPAYLATSEKILFLAKLIEYNCKGLQPLLDTIKQIVIRNNPYIKFEDITPQTDLMAAKRYFENHPEIHPDIIKELNSIGAGFNDLKTIKDKNNGFRIASTYTVNNSNHELDFLNNESDGTIKSYTYLALIHHIIETNGILIVDELDAHFHPLIVEEMINAINQSESQAQLIFTTHNPTFLSERLFKRDQIYFCQKNDDFSTSLYPLSDFESPNTPENLQAEYLSGSFGAIPYFHSINFDKKK